MVMTKELFKAILRFVRSQEAFVEGVEKHHTDMQYAGLALDEEHKRLVEEELRMRVELKHAQTKALYESWKLSEKVPWIS